MLQKTLERQGDILRGSIIGDPIFSRKITNKMNPAYSIQKNIFAMVIDTQEAVCVNAIKLWAKEKGYDDVILIDEAKLKEIISLGTAEYERLHGGD